MGGAEAAPKAILEVHPSIENQTALVVAIPPRLLLRGLCDVEATGGPPEGGEIIFLADRSGSMDDKMGALESAMQFSLKGIPTGRRFNL